MKASARRIVCATDFSENARAAADAAAAIALRLRARLVLVHVADEARAYREGTPEYRLMMRRERSRLRQEGVRLRSRGVPVDETLLHGSWAEAAIVEFLEKDPPALVVVASVSKTTLDRWTIGSVSERIAQESPIPTLVVRAPDRLLGWARQDRPLKVVVAADFTASSDAAIAWVKELRKIGECVITAAQIIWPPAGDSLPAPKTVPSTRLPPSVHRRLARALRQRIGEVLDSVIDVRVEPNWGHPDAALVRLAAETEADLLVVGAHQHHGLKRLAHASVSRGVLRHAPMSVACVPASVALTHGLTRHPHIRRVLVATDFSPAGDFAVPWAYALVPHGGIVKLVHVMEPWELPSPLVPRFDPKRTTRGEYHRQLKRARDRLAALVPLEAEAVSTEVEVIVERDAARGICIAARTFGPDVICLGSVGRTALAETFVGSVARTVVAKNPHPVLLVRPPAP